MLDSDIDRGLELCRAAGWNQVHSDWNFFLAQATCFVYETNDRVVGTCAVLDPAGPVAWIAMMLVDAAVRRQSIASLLFEHTLTQTQAASIGLDATGLGLPMYTKFGFLPAAKIVRWRREAGPIELPSRRAPCPWRRGYGSNQIGPIVAERWGQAADQVLTCLAFDPERSWIIDVPDAADVAWHDWLESNQFRRQRTLTRMYRGLAQSIAPQVYSTSGPDYGFRTPGE
jgi:GNAT superfamily N-acetyltransferase